MEYTTDQLLTNLKCLMLNLGYTQVQYENLDISCPEIVEDKDTLTKVIKFHRLLEKSTDFACDLDSDLLCEINSFVRLNPCTCETCSSTCPSFTVTEQVDDISCEIYTLVEIEDDI